MADVVPRLATRADNAALLDLFSAVPMSGELVLTTERSPDFFALYDLQRVSQHLYVGDDERGLVGMAGALVRDGWLDGRVQKVGYLGDLRLRFDRSKTFARHFGDGFDALCTETGCEAWLTSIMASNRMALRALTARRKGRERQPWYHPLLDFDAVSVQLTRARRPGTTLTVRSATPADVPALVALLDEDHRRRPFGYRFDDGELEHRLAHWPGFSLDDTLLVEQGGRLAGCATVWDPSPVKRFRVHAWNGRMKWVRRGFNAAASVLRWPRLPAPGGEFRYAYLANVSVRGDDPTVLRALVDEAYRRLRPRGFHFFTTDLLANDPLAPALRGFTVQRLGFKLFAVTRATVARTDWPPGRTGFEAALA